MDIVKPSKSEIAAKFACGLNCAQCVLGQCADALGYDEEELYHMAASFGGGMFRGDTCGAVSGALIAIGLAFGGDTPEDTAVVKQKVAELQSAFAEKFGSTICRDLVGFDFSRPGDHDAAAASGKLSDFCPELVCFSVEQLKALLLEA